MSGIEWTLFKIGLAVFGAVVIVGSIFFLIRLWFWWREK